MKLFLSLLTTLAFVSLAQSETEITTKADSTNTNTAIIPASQPATASSILLGFKSFTDSGRAGDLGVDNGRNMKSKNEFFGGYKFASGWGAYLQGVQYYNSYQNNDAKTKWSLGDASFTLLHPDFYKSSDLNLFGQFRAYFQTTDRSIQKSIDQYAYYFRLNAKVSETQEVYNELIPRYFNSKLYSAADTTYYAEDTTIYNYKLNSNWKIGAKSWGQYEVHKDTSPGFCMEVGPQFSYTFNSQLSVSPSIMLPISAKNKVYDGPKAIGTDQAYLDIYLMVRL